MILDPGMVRYSCKRNLHYLAKHTLFSNKIQRWVFKYAGAIPIYRRQDDPNLVSRNRDTFENAYQLFKDGKCLILFPEGISLAARVLFKIKTGAARIALNAEINNNFELDLKIVPVGINYSDASRFKSEVYIQYGDPISLEAYKDESITKFRKSVSDVTARIEESLLELTTNLSFIELEDTISYLELIYKNELFLKNSMGDKKEHDDFSISKELIDVVEWYLEKYPEKKEDFIAISSKYMRFLERLKLDDRFIVSSEDKRPKILPEEPLEAIWFIIQFPVYLYGLINNYIPYRISATEVSTKNIDEVEIGQYKFFIGLGVFSSFYFIQTFLVFYFSENMLWGFLYFLSLIPTGNFTLKYHNNIVSYLKQFRLFRIFSKRSDIIENLKNQRQEIIIFIMNAKKEYEESENNEN